MKKKLLGVSAVLGALALLNGIFPTSADAWTITVTGTIYSDQGEPPINSAGLFGTPGVSLIGSAYTETITTDPSRNTIVEGNGSSFSQTRGGQDMDPPKIPPVPHSKSR